MTIETALRKLNIPKIGGNPWQPIVTEWAKKGGFDLIGEGQYGAVYYRKGDAYAVKVFTDFAYYEWIKLCKTALKGNPWVPIFKGMPILIQKNTHKFYNDDYDVFIIRIEKLSRENNINKLSRLIDLMYDLIRGTKYSDNTSRYKNDKNLLNVTKSIRNLLDDKPFNIHLDLHIGNIMKRGNQLVIIDPIM